MHEEPGFRVLFLNEDSSTRDQSYKIDFQEIREQRERELEKKGKRRKQEILMKRPRKVETEG